jgi:hypothetical protein
MRRRVAVMATAGFLIAGLAIPGALSAKHVVAFGSLLISQCSNQACSATAPLTTEVVVFTVTANPGLEKTMTALLQGPPFVVPVIVNSDNVNPGSGDLNTIVVITDLTGNGLTVSLAVRDQGGNPVQLTSSTVAIPANGTAAVSLANLLP